MKFLGVFKNLNGDKKRTAVLALFLFLAALAIRVIKAGYFLPWGTDEDDAFLRSRTLDEALRWYKWHPMPPFHLMVNFVFKTISSGSVFWQRFHTVLAGSLSVPLFYATLNHVLPKRKYWPLILTLIPLTNFILVYYSQEIRSYAYFWFLALATFYYGYRVFVEDREDTFGILFLLFSFALLPLTHYLSLQHLLVLDLTLFFSVLLLSAKKWKQLFKLAILNLFVPLSYITWSDSAFYMVIMRGFLIGRFGEKAVYKPFRFDSELFWATFDKLVGGREIWACFLFYFCGVAVFILTIRLVKKLCKKQEIDRFDRFTVFSVLYSFILFLMALLLRSSEPLNSRHYLFIIWQFLFIFSYGIIRIWELPVKRGRWVGKVAILPILIFFIGDNVVNTTFYLLSSHRFFMDPRPAAELMEPMIESGQKTMVYSEIAGYDAFVPFFKHPERVSKDVIHFYPQTMNILDARAPKRLNEIQRLIDCCGQQTIFIFGTNSKQRDIFWPRVDFKDLTTIKQFDGDKHLDYLMDIDAAPYAKKSGMPYGYGTYMVAY